jgi:hypothetical protein
MMLDVSYEWNGISCDADSSVTMRAMPSCFNDLFVPPP